jgi:hypothetical protein
MGPTLLLFLSVIAVRFSDRFYTLVFRIPGVHSALVRINEELLERKLAAPV